MCFREGLQCTAKRWVDGLSGRRTGLWALEPWRGRASLCLLCILYSIGSAPFVTRTTQVLLYCSRCFETLSLGGDRVWSGKTWVRVFTLLLSSCINLGKSLSVCDSSSPYLENGTSTSCFTGQLRGSNMIEEELPYKIGRHDQLLVVAGAVIGDE